MTLTGREGAVFLATLVLNSYFAFLWHWLLIYEAFGYSANKNLPRGGLVLRAKQSTVNASPSFEWFTYTVFPVCQFRHDHGTRLDIETERGFALKAMSITHSSGETTSSIV